MGKISSFRDLIVWQKAHQLVLKIYELTKKFPREESYSLTNQLRRAAISVASNIVEGFNRTSLKESLQFYNLAKSSLSEVEYQILLALDLKYISQEEKEEVQNLITEVGKLIFSWSRSQKRNASH